MKLSAAQRKALSFMVGTTHVNEKFMPVTVVGLLKAGLVERYFSPISFGKKHFSITEAGRNALDKERGG